MFKHLLQVFLSALCCHMVASLPTELGFYEEVPQPVRVSSFNTQQGGHHPYSNHTSPHDHRAQSSGGPWQSLTAEPVPQTNLPIPEGALSSFQGVNGTHKCFPGDGCYFGYWNLYLKNWLPPVLKNAINITSFGG